MKFSNIERFLRLSKLRPPTRSPSVHIVSGNRALAKRALALTTSLSFALASVPFLPTTAYAWGFTYEKGEDGKYTYYTYTPNPLTEDDWDGPFTNIELPPTTVRLTSSYNYGGESGDKFTVPYPETKYVSNGSTRVPVFVASTLSRPVAILGSSSAHNYDSRVRFYNGTATLDGAENSVLEVPASSVIILKGSLKDVTIKNKDINRLHETTKDLERTGPANIILNPTSTEVEFVNVNLSQQLTLMPGLSVRFFNVDFSKFDVRPDDDDKSHLDHSPILQDSYTPSYGYSGEVPSVCNPNTSLVIYSASGISLLPTSFTLGRGASIGELSFASPAMVGSVNNRYGSWDSVKPQPQKPADTAPPQITVTRTPTSPDTPTSSVTLKFECKDPQGNDIEKPLSIDNGEPVASPYTITVTENKNVSVKATDSHGNFYETVVEVRNIDKSAPVINSLNPSTTDFTKDNITITANATDDQKLHDQGYYWSFTPFDPNGNRISETASSSSSFTVTENGTVSLRVKDSMGNMSTVKTFAVRNIDKTPPKITSISLSPDAHANPRDGVLVTVTVEDTPDASGVTSGLNDTPIMWDSTWGKTERVINNNGVVTLRARDKLGNLSEPQTVSIDFIDSSLPYIGSITPDKTGQFVSSPVTYTVEAFNADGTKLTGKAYSWDDGDTWVSNNKKVITENGEYKLTVKSLAGNTATQTVTVSNVDNVKPSVDMRLVKESRTTQGGRPKDVWVLKVEAKDSGSGMDYIETNWDGKKIKDSYFQADVTKPGLYSVMAVDKAGNSTANEKYITAEMIGSNKEDDKNTDITIDTKPQDGSDLTESGLKSEFADPNNLIYGEAGIYNKVTKNFSTYADANYPGAGIAIAARVEPMDNSYVSGTMSLEGVNYPMKFNKWDSDVKTKLEGDFLYGFIPYNALKSDIKNQRLKIQVFEHEDEKGKTLVRDGSAVVYISAQISDPVIRYSYNKADQLLTIVPTSTVAGVKSTKYSYDGGSPQEYTAPFVCEKNNKINITVTDNVQNTQTLALTGSDLGLEGGTGSLPTEGLNPNSNVKSYRSSSRTSDSYLINGNQSNTDVIPSKEVFELFE